MDDIRIDLEAGHHVRAAHLQHLDFEQMDGFPAGISAPKLRPGSLGLSPASLKLKRLSASAATWPTIMGLLPCLRTRRLSATVYVPLNCCGLPAWSTAQVNLPSPARASLIVALSARVAVQLPTRLDASAGFAGAAGWLGDRRRGGTRGGNAVEQLGGQLVFGIQLHDLLELRGSSIGVAARQVVFGQQEFRLRRRRVRFCVLLQGAELRRVDIHVRIEAR